MSENCGNFVFLDCTKIRFELDKVHTYINNLLILATKNQEDLVA